MADRLLREGVTVIMIREIAKGIGGCSTSTLNRSAVLRTKPARGNVKLNRPALASIVKRGNSKNFFHLRSQ